MFAFRGIPFVLSFFFSVPCTCDAQSLLFLTTVFRKYLLICLTHVRPRRGFKRKCYNSRLIYVWMTMLLVIERVEFPDFFLEENIQLFDRSRNSPDMNPIENAWFILKRKVGQRIPKRPDDLVRKYSLAWESVITPEYWRN